MEKDVVECYAEGFAIMIISYMPQDSIGFKNEKKKQNTQSCGSNTYSIKDPYYNIRTKTLTSSLEYP